jgi:DNA-binding transcriptional LysR family regulator
MTFDQLRVFLAVAERQHMTRASHDLDMAQSAVSVMIGALEAELGVKLFDRVGRGICLSPVGIRFLGEARDLLAHVERARRSVAEWRGAGENHDTVFHLLRIQTPQ